MSLDISLKTVVDGNDVYLFDANITHNLGKMANEAGIYQALWRPEEQGYELAGHLVRDLKIGLRRLKASPKKYKKFNSENGWGMYEHFVPFVEEVLEACKKYPSAKVEVSR